MTNELDQLQAALAGHEHRPVDLLIERDLPCTGCGYNLRGIAENGACPECGRAAVQSIHGDRLHFADPRWMSTIRRGLRLILQVLLGGYLLAITLVSLLPSDSVLGKFLFAVFVPSLASMLMCVGVYRAASREPNPASPEPPMTRRRLTRIISIAAAVSLPAYLACTFDADSHSLYSDDHLAVAVEYILLTGLLAWPVMVYSLFLHLMTLAHRIPDRPLVFQTRVLLVAAPVAVVMIFTLHESTNVIALMGYLMAWAIIPAAIGMVWLYHHALGSAARVAKAMARRG